MSMGPPAGPVGKRSPLGWMLRSGLTTAAAALGYVSAQQTLAVAIGGTKVEWVYSTHQVTVGLPV